MLKERKNKIINIKEKVKENLIIPSAGVGFFALEINSISIFDYLIKIAHTEKIINLTITSFRIAKRDLIILEKMIQDKLIPTPNLILSDSIPTMVVGTYNYLNNNKNFNTKYINTHAKKAEIITEDNHYLISSSGNFNPDGKIEQITILNLCRAETKT